MKRFLRLFMLAAIFITLIFSQTLASSSLDFKNELTKEEQNWIDNNKHRIFTLGIDPYSGMEYFQYQGEERGYVIPLIDIIKKDLGLNIKLEASKTWGEVYFGLQSGSVDILLGANETPERKKHMAFTQPINKNTYAIIAKKESSISTVGDVDKKNIGFMKDDNIIDMFPKIYKNIKYKNKLYDSQEQGLIALNNNEIDAFIMPGGPVVYDYINRFPRLEYAFNLYSITSDMTFSTRKDDQVLAGILNKEILRLKKDQLSSILAKSELDYNLKVMNLTEKEMQWLKNDGKAVVGVTKDYLPFDYYENNIYKGINGEIINEISKKTGIKFTNSYEDFDSLDEKLKKGEIDILNIAKTEERLKYVIYGQPYIRERDIIIGRKESKDAGDIFGLEGKSVAVIKGFWHYELLTKNLVNAKIIETDSIEQSLKMVNEGKVDYTIENPTVAKYYIGELQLYDLVERGVTSGNSYFYFGTVKAKPELASIIDKVIPLIDINRLEKIGIEEVPHVSNIEFHKNLIFTIIGLGIVLFLIMIYVIKLFKALVKEKTEAELLRQREHFLYVDPLTDVYNRNYFNAKVKENIDVKKYPQTVIVADINNLKIVNDTYGHHVGDELLMAFASVIKELLPEDSFVFRMGGDEFHIILQSVNEQKAEEVIAKVKESVAEKEISVGEEKKIRVSVAMGYATRYSAEKDFEKLVKVADERMYSDKSRNKNI